MTTLCRICDQSFEARRLNETICSDACRKENRHIIYKRNYKGSYHKVTATKKICIICKSDFETTNNSQKCCCKECGNINRLSISRKLHQSKRYKRTGKESKAIEPVDPFFLVRGPISNNKRTSHMGEA